MREALLAMRQHAASWALAARHAWDAVRAGNAASKPCATAALSRVPSMCNGTARSDVAPDVALASSPSQGAYRHTAPTGGFAEGKAAKPTTMFESAAHLSTSPSGVDGSGQQQRVPIPVGSVGGTAGEPIPFARGSESVRQAKGKLPVVDGQLRDVLPNDACQDNPWR